MSGVGCRFGWVRAQELSAVGGSEVKAWGGEVKLAEIVEGYSTTAAIARMTEKAP